jgi:hypothetical protein
MAYKCRDVFIEAHFRSCRDWVGRGSGCWLPNFRNKTDAHPAPGSACCQCESTGAANPDSATRSGGRETTAGLRRQHGAEYPRVKSLSEEYRAQPGDLLATFTFALTNVSSGPVVIYDTATTCDCTVASLPSKPWMLPSGGAGEIHATIDLSKKVGVVTNQIIVFTSRGNRRLFVKAFAAESK